MSCTATEENSSLRLTEHDGDKIETPSITPGAKMICSFYLEGKCRFGEHCHNVHPSGVVLPKVTKVKRVIAAEPRERNEKKPPLKTAGDVRKRIQWDPDLPKEHFTVGYLDRFTGVVEKPFNAFTWEHLAMVDLDQLAVPQHRIQFYKYKDIKVWDKNERLDLVFGSAGGNTTIREVIQSVDEEELDARTCVSHDDDDVDDPVMIIAKSASGERTWECRRVTPESYTHLLHLCERRGGATEGEISADEEKVPDD